VLLPEETNMSPANDNQTKSTIIFDIKANVVPAKIKKLSAIVNIIEVLIFHFP